MSTMMATKWLVFEVWTAATLTAPLNVKKFYNLDPRHAYSLVSNSKPKICW